MYVLLPTLAIAVVRVRALKLVGGTIAWSHEQSVTCDAATADTGWGHASCGSAGVVNILLSVKTSFGLRCI